MVRATPLASVPVGRDRYSVGYSPCGTLAMASSSRTQIAVQATCAAAYLASGRPSVSVRWCPRLLTPVRDSLCQTAVMAFHEGFWTVAGTAAPVIAVAIVISLGELMKELSRWIIWAERIEGTPEPEMKEIRKILRTQTRYSWPLEVLELTNLLIQAGLTVVALVSLEDEANLVSPWWAIAAVIAGLVLLAGCSFSGYWMRMRRVRKMAAQGEAPLG
jgi:hypothetical protein